MNNLIEKLRVLTESMSLCRDLASDNLVRLDLDSYVSDINSFIENYEATDLETDLETDSMKEAVTEIRDSLIDIMIRVQDVRIDDACMVNCTDIDIAACFEEVARLLKKEDL